jgi:hypothetical protein
MAVNNETYGLPNETLQLIASSPDLNFLLPQQGTSAQFATPDVRRSDLISALRNIPGAANPGFTRYANAANGAALTANLRKSGGANNPAPLTMPAYVAPPQVGGGGGEIQNPGIVPIAPFVPDVVVPELPEPDIFDPGVVDPEPVDPVVIDPEVTPETPDPEVIEPFIDDLPDDPFIPAPLEVPDIPEKTGTVEITPVDPDEESAQDDGTTQGILDEINSWPVNPPEPTPEPLPEPYVETPADIPDLPDTPELQDGSYWDDASAPDLVGPTRGGGGDLDESFDQYLQPEPTSQPEPEPEAVPEPVQAPEPEPELEPTLRDEIVNAIESQPEPEPEPTPEPFVPEPEPYVPEPEPYVPQPEPVPEVAPEVVQPPEPEPEQTLRDEIINAIESQPQPEPAPQPEPEPVPYVPEPEPYVPEPEPAPFVPEPEPYIPEPEMYVPEPYFPEPEPEAIPENEAAFIDAWLADQFGGFDTVADDFGKYGLGVSHFGGGGGKAMLEDFFDMEF